MRRLAAWLVISFVTLQSAPVAHAQSVAGVQSIARETETAQREAAIAYVARLRTGLTLYSASLARRAPGAGGEATRPYGELAAEALAQANRVLAVSGSDTDLEREYEILRTMLGSDLPGARGGPGGEGLVGILLRTPGVDSLGRGLLGIRSSTPVPIFHLAKDVSFTTGVNFLFRSAKDVDSQLDLGTSLLGALAGSAFDAIGADPMKKFLTDHLAVTTSVPFHGSERIQMTAGVALGQVEFPVPFIKPSTRLILWPVANFASTDTLDRALPREVYATNKSSSSWTSFHFDVAITTRKAVDAIKAGKAGMTPFVTVGIAAPYYYPGGPFEAAAALFGNGRTRYTHASSPRLSLGIAVPLGKIAG